MSRKKHRRVAFRRGGENRAGMFAVTLIVLLLLVVVSVNSIRLTNKKKAYEKQVAVLQEAIAKEDERTAELEEFKKYTQTQAYIEEVAKEKLGLVHEGEIVFKMK
ncbi:MAG: septum formation initiator family protein [Lachnospiraceae bacterium]|nr:septum formation initiator family protein [Lachnospiraceae bacterium]